MLHEAGCSTVLYARLCSRPVPAVSRISSDDALYLFSFGADPIFSRYLEFSGLRVVVIFVVISDHFGLKLVSPAEEYWK